MLIVLFHHMIMVIENEETSLPVNGTQRMFAVLRALIDAPKEGERVTKIAQKVGLTQSTTHRLLQSLVQEDMVEQDEHTKLYRLAIAFFSLAASAGRGWNLRDAARPSLLKLCAALDDTIFLLVRSRFDAVCVDRIDGPYPIRAFTRDIGEKIPLGVGQAALVMLSYLPEREQSEIIRYNMPRLREYGEFDEVSIRLDIQKVLKQGYAVTERKGVLDGMAGLAVPIFDRNGTIVASLTIGTLMTRLSEERIPLVYQLLQKEAQEISQHINPFDPAFRKPMQYTRESSV